MEQAALPDAFLYFPAAHFRHAPPEPTKPTSQSHLSIPAPVVYEYESNGHAIHVVWPTAEYFPTAHTVHAVWAPVEYVPAAHALQFQPSGP
jgi:hypothetical protein